MPKKTKLSEFQAAISQAVMRPLAGGDAMRPENHATARAFIKPNDRLTSADRLQIYNQQYWWRLLGSFAEDFRGLRAVLGERKFNKLAVAYLDECGSRSWNLRDLGSHLEEYIRQHPESVAPHGELAIQMAQVEWARITAFDNEQKPLLDVAKFVARQPARQTLSLQPYVHLLKLDYPIDHLLRRLRRSENNSASNAVSSGLKPRSVRLTAKPLPQPIHLAIHRLDLLVYYKRLAPEAYQLLTALRAGSPLEAACEMAFSHSLEKPESISKKVETWFAAWMSFGWLCERK